MHQKFNKWMQSLRLLCLKKFQNTLDIWANSSDLLSKRFAWCQRPELDTRLLSSAQVVDFMKISKSVELSLGGLRQFALFLSFRSLCFQNILLYLAWWFFKKIKANYWHLATAPLLLRVSEIEWKCVYMLAVCASIWIYRKQLELNS